MSWAAIALWLIVLPPVQSSALEIVAIDHAVPNLLLLLCLYVALHADRRDALVAAWLVGMAHDVFSQTPIGQHALLYAALAEAICLIRVGIFTEHLLSRMLLAAAAALALAAADLALTRAGCGPIAWGPAVRHALLCAAYTALVCPVACAAFGLTRRLAGRRTPSSPSTKSSVARRNTFGVSTASKRLAFAGRLASLRRPGPRSRREIAGESQGGGGF